MQPPLTSGTILQNRYRIIETLGQGGFGRTYLAEDQRRFDELCAIKELILTGTQWEKAQELFQREAAILYKIQHPQVPQFRENFEQDQRLFLVQEYVAGKTYRTLLDERKTIGGAFTEREVLQLMRSLLPILEHIHSRGIIHRDISPENIILRDGDHLPVLIDFGVVKEIATRLQTPLTKPATSVGKFGYAPSEQMQTGRAYPNSDLYSLAVTAVVLLTGKEPSELFDENQLTWNWQSWVTVNSQFATVLNRMLSYRPSTRYQNATEVLLALQGTQPTASTTNIQTVAVGRRPDPVQPPTSPNRPAPVIPEPATKSILDNPLAMGAIGSTIFFLAGFGSWALVSNIRNQSKEAQTKTRPQTFPSPVISGGTASTVTPTPTPTLTPTSTPTPLIGNQAKTKTRRISFRRSKTVNTEGNLKENQTIQYTFFARKGQQLTALFAQEQGVLLSVIGPNQQPVEDTARQVKYYQGTLPATGNYTIELNLGSGISQSNYSLNVGLENQVQPTPAPSPTQIPIPSSTQIPLVPSPTFTPPTPLSTDQPTTQPPSVIPTPNQSPSPSGLEQQPLPGGIPQPSRR